VRIFAEKGVHEGAGQGPLLAQRPRRRLPRAPTRPLGVALTIGVVVAALAAALVATRLDEGRSRFPGTVAVDLDASAQAAAARGSARGSARGTKPLERRCPSQTFGTVTFEVIVRGISCASAEAVVERQSVDRSLPHGWTCAALHCWLDGRSYEAAPARLAELIDVRVARTVAPAHVRLCAYRAVRISTRQNITCLVARKALGQYFRFGNIEAPPPDRSSNMIVGCNGTPEIGGYCAVTYYSGAQGQFEFNR
jgi:hypothetical protein